MSHGRRNGDPKLPAPTPTDIASWTGALSPHAKRIIKLQARKMTDITLTLIRRNRQQDVCRGVIKALHFCGCNGGEIGKAPACQHR